MIKKNSFPLLTLFLVLVMAFVSAANAQPKRKLQAKPSIVPKMKATGLLYFAGDGQRIQNCLLKTPEGIIEIYVTGKTRIVHFSPTNEAWSLGSEWRVTYQKSKDAALNFEADTVTFTGNSDLEIAVAETIARDYLTALSTENKDYEKAYSQLSEALRQKLSVAGFRKMYQPVEFDIRSIKVCSNSQVKVVMLLTYFGSDTDFFQPVEIAATDDKSHPNQSRFRISRLFDLEKNAAEAEAACRRQ